jgi:phosphate transport system permease protein
MSNSHAAGAPPKRTIDLVNASLKRRYARERRFRLVGLAAVIMGLSFVGLLFADIIARATRPFSRPTSSCPVTFDAATLDPAGDARPRGPWRVPIIRRSFGNALRASSRTSPTGARPGRSPP